MRRSKLLAAFGIAAAAIGIAANAGATTQAVSTPRILQPAKGDLSSVARINEYLRSRGVNPRSVVIQRGNRNYAGPNCPGRRWNCTTARRVLQVGSQNTFECTSGGTQSGSTQTCIGFMQNGESNTFRCVERTSLNHAIQQCGVSQVGVRNFASIEQVADTSTNTVLDQDATQLVRMYQQAQPGSPPKNELHVTQRIKESMATTGAQVQDGHQFVVPAGGNTEIQVAGGGGNNYSDINQYIDLLGSGAATSQSQNTGGLPTDVLVPECTPSGPPAEPNQCVEGDQLTDTGVNESHLHQLIDEDAKTTNPVADQTQGQPDGGTGSDVHQTVTGPGDSPVSSVTASAGAGRSENHADLARRQSVSGGDDQTQIDPGRCCGVSQQGGQNNRQDINEAAMQKSDGNAASQVLTLIGQCNTTNGYCLVAQHARNDQDHSNFNCGSPGDTACPPYPPGAVTHCESTEFGGGEGTGTCVTPDDAPILLGDGIFIGSAILPGVPLSGFEVAMGLLPAP
jgi:hypothetical protein